MLDVDDIDANPILLAIDKGGGQTCNIPGVIRALHQAGFAVVSVPPAPGADVADVAAMAAWDDALRRCGLASGEGK